MKILHKMLLKETLKYFLGALVFFVMMILMGDIMANLLRYFFRKVSFLNILKVSFYFIPKAVSYALPLALLTGTSLVLGDFYAHNELIPVLSAGISLFRLTRPLLIFSLFLSIGNFYFDDRVVTPSYRIKLDLSRRFLENESSNKLHTLIGRAGEVIYNFDYYNKTASTLSGVTVIKRDSRKNLLFILTADSAVWNPKDNLWGFRDVRLFRPDSFLTTLSEKNFSDFSDQDLDEAPGSFSQMVSDINEMTLGEGKRRIRNLKATGLPYLSAETEYYKRCALFMSPFIVMLISCSLGFRFGKKSRLMNLLISLVIAVVYFVFQYITVIIAKMGFLPPLAGAGAPLLLFFGIGVILYRRALT